MEIPCIGFGENTEQVALLQGFDGNTGFDDRGCGWIKTAPKQLLSVGYCHFTAAEIDADAVVAVCMDDLKSGAGGLRLRAPRRVVKFDDQPE